MTNEQAKQEAIKKAYGNHYNIFKPNENGIGSAIGGIDENKYETISNGYVNTYRPKVLRGIENNNGWIRIEPDGSNLPEDDGKYKLCFENNIVQERTYTLAELIYRYQRFKSQSEIYNDLTHYKPITPELLPIY